MTSSFFETALLTCFMISDLKTIPFGRGRADLLECPGISPGSPAHR
jgi:hypothetical protein